MKPTAFEKRVKRRVVARQHTYFAVCPPGLRHICRDELAGLDADITGVQVVPGGVAFEGKLDAACHANLALRSPARILMRIARFRVERFDRFEKQLRDIDWELFLPPGPEPDIRVTARKSRLYHTDAIVQRCRPIIKDALPPLKQPAPSSAQTLMIRAENDVFTLSLDMSGPPLFKRGIKQQVVGAPLRENLAFAILARAWFRPGDVLVDPMCGSGTFTLEGAMIQSRIPPGFFRGFACEAWPGFRPARFAHLKREMENRFLVPGPAPLFASDMDPDAVQALEANLAGHPFLDGVRTGCQDFFDLDPTRLTHKKGVVVLNPPYGRRLAKGSDMDAFYREIQTKLARDFTGWRAGIILPERQMRKIRGLDLSPFPFFHGGLDLTAGVGMI